MKLHMKQEDESACMLSSFLLRGGIGKIFLNCVTMEGGLSFP